MPLGDYALFSSRYSCVLLKTLTGFPFVIGNEPVVPIKYFLSRCASHFGKAHTEIAECEERSVLFVVLGD